MSIVVDIVIVAIIALCIFLGYKRGLIGVAYKILSFFVAIIVAFILVNPISSFIIKNTNWDEQLETVAIETITKQQEKQEQTEQKQDMVNTINNYIEDTSDAVKQDVANNLAPKFASMVINGGVFIALFLGTRIIFFFLKFIGDFIAKIPIIKQFNKLGGTVYGVLEGILIVYLILAIFTLITPIINSFGILEYINHSLIGSFMYQNNLLLKILF